MFTKEELQFINAVLSAPGASGQAVMVGRAAWAVAASVAKKLDEALKEKDETARADDPA